MHKIKSIAHTSTYSQFHQHFTCAFLPIFLDQNFSKPNCDKRKAAKTLLYEKSVCKMLMKLTPCVSGNWISLTKYAGLA